MRRLLPLFLLSACGLPPEKQALLDVKQFIQTNLDALAIDSQALCDAAPTPMQTAVARIRAASATRVAASSCLESATPAIARTPAGMTSAHATTGPASGPRPTSSTPASTGPYRVRRVVSRRLQRAMRPRPAGVLE